MAFRVYIDEDEPIQASDEVDYVIRDNYWYIVKAGNGLHRLGVAIEQVAPKLDGVARWAVDMETPVVLDRPASHLKAS